MKKKAATNAARAPRRKRDDKDGILDVTIVLLAEGYMSTAIGPIEVFHSAGSIWNWLHGQEVQPRFRVHVASLDGKKVNGLCSMGFVPQCSIHDIKHTDIIIVPASGWDVMDVIARHSDLVPWLKKWHARGAYVAGVCTGAAFLAEGGLLDGKRATTHWGVADIMRQRYPKVDWRTENFVTEDGRVFCSGGVYASIDLSLYLVEKFCGHEVALQVAKALLLSMPRSRQSGYAVVPLSRPHADEKIRTAEEYLQKHFERGVPIEELADRPAWACAISFAASRQRLGRCRVPIFRRCAWRRRRRCWRVARCRSRKSAARSATRTRPFSASCSSVIPG